MGHAESHSRSRRGIDKFLAFRQLDRERFLHEHVLAGLDRLPRHGKVQVVRQADRHGADLRVGDQLPGIQVRPHAVGLKRPQQRGLGIGHGHRRPARARRTPATWTWPISPRPSTPTAAEEGAEWRAT